MNREELNDKALQEIFKRISDSPIPENLNRQIMQKIQKAQKIREIRNIAIVALTSIAMLLSACHVLIYLDFNPVEIFSPILKKTANFTLFPGFTFLLCVTLSSILLLWIDYRFRKHFKNLL